MPPWPMMLTSRSSSRARWRRKVLEHPELSLAAHERRPLARLRRPAPSSGQRRGRRPIGRHRCCLALQVCSPAGSNAMAWPRRRRGFTDQQSCRAGRPTAAGSGVHQVPGHHALVLAPSVTAASPVSTPARASRDPPAQPRNGLYEFEHGANRPLGVILMGRRHTPDCHDRVTDELLGGAAIAPDHLACRVEVPRQHVPRVLRVADPPRKVVKPTRSANRTLTSRRSAARAGACRRRPSAGAAAPPRSRPDRRPSGWCRTRRRTWPPAAFERAAGRAGGARGCVPHSAQNLAPAALTVPQARAVHRVSTSSVGRRRARRSPMRGARQAGAGVPRNAAR